MVDHQPQHTLHFTRLPFAANHFWAMRHAMRQFDDGQVVLIQVLSELRAAEERCREQQDSSLGPSGLAQVRLCLAHHAELMHGECADAWQPEASQNKLQALIELLDTMAVRASSY